MLKQTLKVFLTIFILSVSACTQLSAQRCCSWTRMHGYGVEAAYHLSAQHSNVSELCFDQWFSDALAYSQIKSWRVTGFEAAVTLLATAQCRGGLSAYLAVGWCLDVLSAFQWKKICSQTVLPTFTLKNIHIILALVPHLSSSVQCVPQLFFSATKSPFVLDRKEKSQFK